MRNFSANWDWPTAATGHFPAPRLHSSMFCANGPRPRKKSTLHFRREQPISYLRARLSCSPQESPQILRWVTGLQLTSPASPCGTRPTTPSVARLLPGSAGVPHPQIGVRRIKQPLLPFLELCSYLLFTYLRSSGRSQTPSRDFLSAVRLHLPHRPYRNNSG